MQNDFIFTNISDPELILGNWYVHLTNNREELKVKIDEAFAPLIQIADRSNEKFIAVNLNDLSMCLEFGEVSLHIIQYDIQKCYVRFELYIDGHLFRANIEEWRAIAFAKAFHLPVHCSEELWYDIITDITRSKLTAYNTGFLHLAIPFVRSIADDNREPLNVREAASKREGIIYQELGKRSKLGGLVGGLTQNKIDDSKNI